MKKLHVLSLAALLLGSLAACGSEDASSEPGSQGEDPSAVKVGLICLHDENSTYDANFINGLNEAVANLGDKVIFESNCLKTGIEENNDCYTAAIELVNKGCKVIFADSFGHDSFMLKAAKEHPEVQFCHATGTKSTVNEDVVNFHNAFAAIYEGRFLAGYAAGLKLRETNVVNGRTDSEFPGQILGYVGAYPFAEVKSGYTSWFLGVRQALEDYSIAREQVTMEVQFTNDWYLPAAEGDAARSLIAKGATLISQHADSMGAPAACELAGVPNITYNIETGDECEDTYLGYSRINWAPYYEAVINAVYNKTSIEGEVKQNWTGTVATGSVQYNVNWDNLSKDATRLAEYKNKMNDMETAIKEGTYDVFNTAKFTLSAATAAATGATIDADGHVTSYLADVIDEGDYQGETEVILTKGDHKVFAESKFRSAPYFDLDIEGIVL